MKKFNLDKVLKTMESDTCTCQFCKNEELRKTIQDFMEKKAAGKTFISLNRLFDLCLVPMLGAPKNQNGLYRHVQVCMGLDSKTGKPLNDK